MYLLIILAVLAFIMYYQYSTGDQIGGEPENKNDQKVDSADARNVSIILKDRPFTSNGILTEFQYSVASPGKVHFQVYRPTNTDNIFNLVGENIHEITELTGQKGSLKVSPSNQIVFEEGDVMGLRFPDEGTVAYRSDSSVKVLAVSGSSQGVGSNITFPSTLERSYDLQPSFTVRPKVRKDKLGGNPQRPAESAQAILEYYQKNDLGLPVDGTYWIRSLYMTESKPIWCNFSNHKGHAYMLVASVAAGDEWSEMEMGSFPFNPQFSQGEYDGTGRNSTYYRKWEELDPSSVLDSRPAACARGGFMYNTDENFCAEKADKNKRIKLEGGLDKVMVTTGNNKHWIVVKREDMLPGNKARAIADSNNFGDKCSNPRVLTIDNKSSAVNVSLECDPTYVFWGKEEENVTFMKQNNGIRIYVGGAHKIPKPSSYPNNPEHYRAAGRKYRKSTYNDAVRMCSALGKKVCSKSQLMEAVNAGYSKCACGWTSDREGNKRQIGYPTSGTFWAAKQGRENPSSCGNPGFNSCGAHEPHKRKGDIFCCDKLSFSSDFSKLQAPYKMAGVWLTDIEHEFNKIYGADIPDTRFIVFNSEGYGVAVKKTKGEKYELTDYSNGRVPTGLKAKALIDRGILPKAKAIFLDGLPGFGIRKNVAWPDGRTSMIVRYGSVIRIKSDNYKLHLDSTNGRYWHSRSSRRRQVYGKFGSVGSGANWLIKAERGLGHINADGSGSENAKFGLPIVNGSIVRLEAKRRNLSSSTWFREPSTRWGPEVNLASVGQKGDSTEYWRIEVIGSRYLYSNSKFRLVHVNTGRMLTVSNDYNIRRGRGPRVKAISLSTRRNDRTIWRVKPLRLHGLPNMKCLDLVHEMAKMRTSKSLGGSINMNKFKNTEMTYNDKCRKITLHDYNKGISPELKAIRNQNRQLSKVLRELKKLEDINKSKKLSRDQKTDNKNRLKAELEKLLNKRCPIVRECVPRIESRSTYAPRCKDISSLLESSKNGINDVMIEKIKSVKSTGFNVNMFDIATHKEYPNLVKISNIKPCYDTDVKLPLDGSKIQG